MKQLITLLLSIFILGTGLNLQAQYEQTFDGTSVPAEYSMIDSDIASNLRIVDGKLAFDVSTLETGNQLYVGININLDIPINQLPQDVDSTITFTITASSSVTAHVRGWLVVDDSIPANWEGGWVGMTGWWSQTLGETALTPTFSIDDMLKDPDIIANMTAESRITRLIIDVGEGPAGAVTLYFDDINIPTNFTNVPPYEVKLSNKVVADESPAGTLVGVLSTDEEEVWQHHLYTLVAGDGDDDNGSFSISNDTLFMDVAADYSTKSAYKVRVESYDYFGGSIAEQLDITVSQGTAIELKSAADEVKAYFNSAKQIQIESTGEVISRVAVTDLTGRVIFDKAIHSNNPVIALDEAPTGLYFVTMQKGDHRITKKVIK